MFSQWLLPGVLKQDKGGQCLVVLLLLMMLVVPVLNLVLSEDSSLHVSTYWMTLLGKYLAANKK